MVTVALIGADGAGKTTIARRLEESGVLRAKYIYMGVNPEASNHMLPTTRLLRAVKRALGRETHAGGPPDPARRADRSGGVVRRGLSAVKSALRTANQLAEEWYRQSVAWYYQRRGFVVLFDRHFYSDYHAHDVTGLSGRRSLARRIHGLVLGRWYPRPDLVVLLDAPAAVLHARKPEGTVELIERRREEYLRLREEAVHFAVVDADRPLDVVVEDVECLIREFLALRSARGASDTARDDAPRDAGRST